MNIDEMKRAKKRDPNDNRSNTLNPNSPAYQTSRNNGANQLNPNNPKYKGSNIKNKKSKIL